MVCCVMRKCNNEGTEVEIIRLESYTHTNTQPTNKCGRSEKHKLILCLKPVSVKLLSYFGN